MDRQTALQKIKKCLALATSSNANEAGVALRQAQALMRQFGVDEPDLLAMEVNQSDAKSGAKATPARWEDVLAITVARAFGCKHLFVTTHRGGVWRFIGVGSAAELAGYAMQVLTRQARAARAEYIRDKLQRCKTATKTRRADLFSMAWVNAVREVVGQFAESSERNRQAIEVFISQRYPKLSKLESRDRTGDGPKRDHEWRDLQAGQAAGRNAQLKHGIAQQPLALTDAR